MLRAILSPFMPKSVEIVKACAAPYVAVGQPAGGCALDMDARWEYLKIAGVCYRVKYYLYMYVLYLYIYIYLCVCVRIVIWNKLK